ncbi:MAG: hypothetical protein AAGC43_14360 [Bacteroidota bacterium]
MKRIFFALIVSSAIGCNQQKGGIKKGTFQIIENDSVVGKIYRYGSYQIELYPNGKEVAASINYLSDSTYVLSGLEKQKDLIDSITWLNIYKEKGKDSFMVMATPSNINTNYQYEGLLVKIDDEVNETYLKKLDSLNENM